MIRQVNTLSSSSRYPVNYERPILTFVLQEDDQVTVLQWTEISGRTLILRSDWKLLSAMFAADLLREN